MPDTADTSANNTRTVHYGTRRRARLSQPSATLPGTYPPDDTLTQRCGRPHEQGLDIRDLCPPHANPPHGNARYSQGPSGISASLLDSYDGHKHPTPPSVSDLDWCVPPASTHVYPTDDSRSCYARPYRDCPCCGHSAPFSGRRECLS